MAGERSDHSPRPSPESTLAVLAIVGAIATSMLFIAQLRYATVVVGSSAVVMVSVLWIRHRYSGTKSSEAHTQNEPEPEMKVASESDSISDGRGDTASDTSPMDFVHTGARLNGHTDDGDGGDGGSHDDDHKQDRITVSPERHRLISNNGKSD